MSDDTIAIRKRSRLALVAALAIAGVAFVVLAIGGIGKNLVYYWGPSELVAAGDKAYGATIRLGGQVKAGSVQYANGPSNLAFEVTDRKADVKVVSTGVPPQMFREGIGVVVEGTMDRDGTFHSNRLMVSHGNEYKAPTEGQTVNAEELIRSTSGLEEKDSPQ